MTTAPSTFVDEEKKKKKNGVGLRLLVKARDARHGVFMHDIKSILRSETISKRMRATVWNESNENVVDGDGSAHTWGNKKRKRRVAAAASTSTTAGSVVVVGVAKNY